jgi:hypothetical protein
MRKNVPVFTVCLLFFCLPLGAESFRALVAGKLEVSLDNAAGTFLPLGISSSAFVSLGEGARFFRGVELELSAPQNWLAYRGSLAMVMYAEVADAEASDADSAGARMSPRSPSVNDLEGRRIAFEPLPNKLKIVYQLPIRPVHGLKTSPYVTVPSGVVLPASFPVLFRLMPIVKGLNEELEAMVFQFSAKPIFSDEGAVKLNSRYPDQLRGKPFTVLIDDVVIDNLAEERLLKEGEHRLVVLSEDYRNESRRFVVERARVLELTIELHDPTPLIVFEGPQNARIFLDNTPVLRQGEPVPTEPGIHEARFLVGDYTLTRVLNIQRGKTYRVALAVDINVLESE